MAVLTASDMITHCIVSVSNRNRHEGKTRNERLVMQRGKAFFSVFLYPHFWLLKTFVKFYMVKVAA